MEKRLIIQQLDLGPVFEALPVDDYGEPIGSPVVYYSNVIDNRRRPDYKPFSSVFIKIESSYIPIIGSLVIEYSTDNTNWFAVSNDYDKSALRNHITLDNIFSAVYQPTFNLLSGYNFEVFGNQLSSTQQHILFTGGCSPPPTNELFSLRASSSLFNVQVFPYYFRFKVSLYTVVVGYNNYVLNEYAILRIRAYARIITFN